MEFDFGITALGQRFHMDWRHGGDDPGDVVRRWAALVSGDDDGRHELLLLHADLRSLIASPLPDHDLRVLWRTAAPYYPVGERTPVGRSWLAEADREIRPFLPDATSEGIPLNPVDREVRESVTTLAERLRPTRELPLEQVPARVVSAAVRRCAGEVSAALAFRFLLHAYEGYDAPVPVDLRSLFAEVNGALGYGAFMLAPLADRTEA